MMIKNQALKASITVEASFTFTITIFVFFLMLGPLFIIKTSSDFMLELNNLSKSRCDYEMIKYGAKDTTMYKKVEDYLNNNDELSKGIEKLEDVVNYSAMLLKFHNRYDALQSEYNNISLMYDMNSDTYDVDTGIVKYDYLVSFNLPYNFFNIENISKRLVNVRRAFIGSDGDRFSSETEVGNTVYVARNVTNSSVYHSDINCTYLKKKTINFEYSNLSTHRNYNNKKYSKCDYCFKSISLNGNTKCYVTQYGDKYHSISTCPKMTAYTTQLPIECIDEYNLRPCFRCVKKEE